jgi:glycosyltransferase involved in cell wall biosynthesis
VRIALLCSDLGIPLGGVKGASVHLRAVASSLMRMGHQVAAIVANAGVEEGYRPLTERGLELRVLRQPRTVREVDWHLSQVQPQLVIERLSLLAPEGAVAAAEAGVPHVYEVNAPLDEEAARHRKFERMEEAHAAFATGFAASRGAIAVSDEVARWVCKQAPSGFPVRVESNGAGPEFLAAPDARQLIQLERRLRLTGGEFRVGFVGTFRPWHDIDTLLFAASELAKNVPTRVLMVGDGPQRNHVLRTAWSGRAAVTLAGAVPHHEVPSHLALCDAVAVPYAEGEVYFSPLKLVEAMAASRPVVASATGPVKRVVTDGRDGLLVPPGDRPAFAAALERLAFEPALRGRLGAEARRTIEREYTWDSVIGRVLKFAAGLPARAEGSWRT